MKRYLVDQGGRIEIEVARQFIVEAADDDTEDEIIRKLETGELPETDDMAWSDTWDDHKWFGYEAELDYTELGDRNGVALDDLPVIKLEDIK